jgi:hypothetical protein
MTHAHINGVCLRPEEAKDCHSPFKTNTGRAAPYTDDDAIRAGIAHTTDFPPSPASQHLYCNIPSCGCHSSPEKTVDICSSGPTPEFLAEQKRWYHSGKRGFDDTKNPSYVTMLREEREAREALQQEFEVDDIADLDHPECPDQNCESCYQRALREESGDDYGYGRPYDCEDEQYWAHLDAKYDPKLEIPVSKVLVRETAGKLYGWSREMDDYFLTQGVLHPVATGLRVLVAQLYGAIG